MDQLRNKQYQIIQLPIDLSLSLLDLSKPDLKAYYKWFLNIKDERLDLFCKFLFDVDCHCVDEGKLSAMEFVLIQFILDAENTGDWSGKSNMPPYLSDIGVSMCYDLGIYLGELIINFDSSIKWKHEMNDRFADYGQPVLVKKGVRFGVNPFRVAKIMASKITDRTYTEGEILKVFSTWKRLFQI